MQALEHTKPDAHTRQQTLSPLFTNSHNFPFFIHKCRSHVDTRALPRYKENTPAAAPRLQAGLLLVAVTMADVIRPSSSAPHSRGPQGRRNHGNGRPEVSRYNWATAALPVCLQSGGSQRSTARQPTQDTANSWRKAASSSIMRTLPLNEEHSLLVKVHSLVFLHLRQRGNFKFLDLQLFFSSLVPLTPPLSSVPF